MAASGWWGRFAERRKDRRQQRAWRRERRKGAPDFGVSGASESSKARHGQVGPAGQQNRAGTG